MNSVNLNGEIIPYDEAHRFYNIDGVFESMKWDNGIALWDLHFERLLDASLVLGFDIRDINSDLLFTEIHKTVDANPKYEFCKVKLSVFSNNTKTYYLIESVAYQPFTNPLRLGIATVAKKNKTNYSHLKTISRQEYESVQEEARNKNWDDAILLNNHGNIVETTIANIFWKKDKQHFTVPLSEGCIAGVGRKHFMKHHQVVEAAATPTELLNADSFFLTNALRGIIEIEEIVS